MPERLEFLAPQPSAQAATPSANENSTSDMPPDPGIKLDDKSDDKPKGTRLDWLAPAGAMALAPIKLGAEKEAQDLLIKQRRLPDVDYKSGTIFSDRISLTMMDNDAERKAYLSDRYGEKNVAQDPAGTFYVTKGGKKVVPSGGGMLEGIAADIGGHGEELALMGEGAAVGRVAGIPGSIIGSMVG